MEPFGNSFWMGKNKPIRFLHRLDSLMFHSWNEQTSDRNPGQRRDAMAKKLNVRQTRLTPQSFSGKTRRIHYILAMRCHNKTISDTTQHHIRLKDCTLWPSYNKTKCNDEYPITMVSWWPSKHANRIYHGQKQITITRKQGFIPQPLQDDIYCT